MEVEGRETDFALDKILQGWGPAPVEESPAWGWESEETSCDLLSMSVSEQLIAPELDRRLWLSKSCLLPKTSTAGCEWSLLTAPVYSAKLLQLQRWLRPQTVSSKALGDTQFTQSENHVSFQFTRPCKELSPILTGVYTALLAEGSWKDAGTLTLEHGWGLGGECKTNPRWQTQLSKPGEKKLNKYFVLSQADK